MKWMFLATIGFGVLAGCQKSAPVESAATAAEEALPEGRDLYAAHVAATGGEAWRAHRTRTMEGEYAMPSQGLLGTMVIRAEAPNKVFTTIELPNIGTIEEGFDGEVAWASDPTMGPRVKTGPELEQARMASSMTADLDFEERYQSLDTVGEVEFDDTAAWQVAAVDKNDMKETLYFAKDTDLLIGREFSAVTPMGTLSIINHYQNYIDFDGVKVAGTTTQAMGPMSAELRIKTMRVNEDDFESIVRPAVIDELLSE